MPSRPVKLSKSDASPIAKPALRRTPAFPNTTSSGRVVIPRQFYGFDDATAGYNTPVARRKSVTRTRSKSVGGISGSGRQQNTPTPKKRTTRRVPDRRQTVGVSRGNEPAPPGAANVEENMEVGDEEGQAQEENPVPVNPDLKIPAVVVVDRNPFWYSCTVM